jgi:hypothetical protein
VCVGGDHSGTEQLSQEGASELGLEVHRVAGREKTSQQRERSRGPQWEGSGQFGAEGDSGCVP